MSSNTIEPFPSDISRDYFGAWLSGFVDGEGYFVARYYHRVVKSHIKHGITVQFGVALRADDIGIIRLIQSFLGCGNVGPKKCSGQSNPMVSFSVTSMDDIFNVVVPNFCRYPLMAKKRNDFLVWREIVSFVYSINRQSRVGCPKGAIVKWTDELVQQYEEMCAILSDERSFTDNGAHR